MLVGRCARQRGEGGTEGRFVVVELRRDGREHAFRTNDPAVMRRPVLEGRGMALLPTYYAVDDLLAGRLLAVLPAFEPEVLGVHAVYLSREHQPLLLRAVIDHLVGRFDGGRPEWDVALTAGARTPG